MARERLSELWKRIDNTHFSYLETDDSPEKLLQRKKLEGYICDYLRLVPHTAKFFLQETGEAMSRSAKEPDFTGLRLARGWAAVARYAANLLAQPWRKEYTAIKPYSGFYKHEVEGSGLCGAVSMLCAMGYKCDAKPNRGTNVFVLDGPVCPDRVAAVSRDSLIAYVECQLMTQIWEEVAMRGGNCSWTDIVLCRESYTGDVEHAVNILLRLQRPSEDIYCNVKYPISHSQYKSESSTITPNSDNLEMNGHIVHHNNGYVVHPNIQSINAMYMNNIPLNPIKLTDHHHQLGFINNPPYCSNIPINLNHMNGHHNYLYNGGDMSQLGNGYYFNQVPGNSYYPNFPYPAMMNGYHPSPMTYPTLPTGQLIEFDSPNNYFNSKTHCCNNSVETSGYLHNPKDICKKKVINESELENQENIRRNSVPKQNGPTIPRSDTQPSLSKAKEDGMGTFENWDYVYRTLENQGYSKDQTDGRNVQSPAFERDSKTLDRIGNHRDAKKYQQTTMDLEDALRVRNLENDEEIFRTAKVNEALLRKKQESEAKAAKANLKKQIIADEREKRKSNSHENAAVENQRITDKTRLISKEDQKIKKEIDKETHNGNADYRKNRKSIVKCLSSDVDKNNKRNVGKESTSVQNGTSHITNQSNFHMDTSNSVDQSLQTRLVVTLKTDNHHSKKDGKWECGTCTYINSNSKKACEMCGKSKQVGVEALPLTSGGKECPACTLVNQREATACAACDTSLKHSPTYI